jgi:hypothetical protein
MACPRACDSSERRLILTYMCMCTRQDGPRVAREPTSTLTWQALEQCTSPSPMPPWVATVPRLTSRVNGRAIERIPAVLSCRKSAIASCTNLRVRSASTHVSPTAINLRPNIPARNKELHDALSALSGAAERYANISRLQLALEGVAAQDAVTRVAGMARTSNKTSGAGADVTNSAWFEQPGERTATITTVACRSIGC